MGLCRETWGEEALFDALKDLPHGRLRLRSAEEAAAQGLPEFDPYGMGRTRLMYAAQEGNKTRVEWLLKRGARLEQKDTDGCTALFFASEVGAVDMVRALRALGADGATVDKHGLSCAQWARRGHCGFAGEHVGQGRHFSGFLFALQCG